MLEILGLHLSIVASSILTVTGRTPSPCPTDGRRSDMKDIEKIAFVIVCAFPLAVWKLIDIIVWIARHMRVEVL